MDNMQPQPITPGEGGISPVGKPKEKTWLITLLSVVSFVFLVLVAAGVAYFTGLAPVDASSEEVVGFEVKSGDTPDIISSNLKQSNLIRSEIAFKIHAKVKGVSGSLKPGFYYFKKSQSTSEIVDSLASGPKIQEFNVTFLPGATLAENKKVLLRLGYSESEIDEAFSADYDHPLFRDRPEGADLEGYIYGETHRFSAGTSVKQVLARYFDDYYSFIQKNNLIEGYRAQGLTLFEGITLASIVQRESGGGDEEQIAQVFLLRLSKGIQLGSDVTYQYIADKTGVERRVDLDSPYNTRRYTGLPPGPIATPGNKALLAVANPAEGDYLYFLSGDDNVTYFAHTEEGHEANIRNHCEQKCQII